MMIIKSRTSRYMHKDYSTENSQHGLQKNNHTSLELGKEAASRVNKVDTVYFAFQALQQSSLDKKRQPQVMKGNLSS